MFIEIIKVEENVMLEYKFFEVKKVWECICDKNKCDVFLF